ncbi:MAG: hypothetical protein U0528_05310 [Anaerolineae bacterium]
MGQTRADLFYDSDGDLDLAAEWLEQNAGADTLIYIASTYYQHPTVLAHPLDSSRIRWMMAEHIFLPPSDREGILIFPRSVPADRWRDVLKPEWKVNDLPLILMARPRSRLIVCPSAAIRLKCCRILAI